MKICNEKEEVTTVLLGSNAFVKYGVLIFWYPKGLVEQRMKCIYIYLIYRNAENNFSQKKTQKA